MRNAQRILHLTKLRKIKMVNVFATSSNSENVHKGSNGTSATYVKFAEAADKELLKKQRQDAEKAAAKKKKLEKLRASLMKQAISAIQKVTLYSANAKKWTSWFYAKGASRDVVKEFLASDPQLSPTITPFTIVAGGFWCLHSLFPEFPKEPKALWGKVTELPEGISPHGAAYTPVKTIKFALKWTSRQSDRLMMRIKCRRLVRGEIACLHAESEAIESPTILRVRPRVALKTLTNMHINSRRRKRAKYLFEGPDELCVLCLEVGCRGECDVVSTENEDGIFEPAGGDTKIYPHYHDPRTRAMSAMDSGASSATLDAQNAADPDANRARPFASATNRRRFLWGLRKQIHILKRI